MKISGKKMLIVLAIACAIAIGVAFARGILNAEGKDVLRCLSDAFFVSGALILFSGVIVWCADNGVADGLTYGASRLFKRRGVHYEENRESYSEYKERKHAKKLKVAEFILAGGVFLLLSILTLIPYWA